jgi:hypothetical protein
MKTIGTLMICAGFLSGTALAETINFDDPFLFFDQLGLHDRDLPGGSAEGNEAKLQPEAKRFGKRWRNMFARANPSGGGSVSLGGAGDFVGYRVGEMQIS